MDFILSLLAVVLGFVVFDLAALAWGADSRDGLHHGHRI
jgi:hypothetical protein